MVMSIVKRELNEKTLIPKVERTSVNSDELPEEARFSQRSVSESNSDEIILPSLSFCARISKENQEYE